ncbi:Dynein assembly factor with WDR repeat domains 1-like [Homarus americanus]|uniref:Dynein assembly factor with WDR repeat domains 1-like n=1 Tax=Homarus americanus TaxID=6706 RepID=A0A8J5N8H5_HOMAM|nr:Dynein assembly factor with WDR repeat domains 1-like [Homarus americanus]
MSVFFSLVLLYPPHHEPETYIPSLLSSRSSPPTGLTFELTDSRGSSCRREVDLFDLRPDSQVNEVVREVTAREACAIGQRGRVQRLVGRLVQALHASTHHVHKRHTTLRAHILPLTNVALNKEASLCATGSYDRECRLWRTEDGGAVTTLKGHQDVVFDVTFAGKHEPPSLSLSRPTPLYDHIISPLPYSPYPTISHSLPMFSSPLRIPSLSPRPLTPLHNLSLFLFSLYIPFSSHRSPRPFSELVATCSFDGTVRVWEAATGSCELVLAGHDGPVAVVASLPTSRQFLTTGGMDTSARIWDLHMGHKGAVVGVGGDRSGHVLYTASFDGTVRLWDARTHENSGTLVGHDGEVNGAGMSWCGRYLASWGTDASAQVWDLRHTHHTLYTLHHDAEVVSGAWDSCGRQLVTGGVDRTAHLLYLPTLTHTLQLDGHGGEVSQECRGHEDEVFSLAVSYSGQVMVTGSRDSTCVIWRHSHTPDTPEK